MYQSGSQFAVSEKKYKRSKKVKPSYARPAPG
jgi:hypothetical protein